MAMTHDYLDYLNQRVGIAPANSQEELQAAETIASLMGQHDVEPVIEEFDVPSVSGLVPAIISIAMFLGALVSGFGVGALTLIGFLLAAVPAVLALLRAFGREPSLAIGPSARSQNVIAVHRATGPLVIKGSRPIVVVAHYDTPHENFLYSTAIAPYLPLISRVSAPCSYAVAACAFVQLLGFIPAPARIVFWVLGILASLPAVLLAVGAIYERVSPCTLGANDNKASVASLLGVMENVRPSGLVPTPRPVVEPEPQVPEEEPAPAVPAHVAPEPQAASAPEEPAPAAAPEPAAAPAPAAPTEKVVGVRHGAEVLRELGILPEGCEIEYDLPPVAAPAPAPAPAPPRAAAPASLPIDVPAPAPVAMAEPAPMDEPDFEPEPEGEHDSPSPLDTIRQVAEGLLGRVTEMARSIIPAPAEETDDAAAQLPSDEGQHDAPVEDVPAPMPADEPLPTPAVEEVAAPAEEPEQPTEPQAAPVEPVEETAPFAAVSDDQTTRDELLSTGRFSLVMDDETSHGVGPKDSSGLTELGDTAVDLDATQPSSPVAAPRPEAPDDPEWGKAGYRPQVSNVARRATLFDLPDPNESAVDPLGSTGKTRPTRSSGAPGSLPVITAAALQPEEQPLEDEGQDASQGALSGFLGRAKGLFSRLTTPSAAEPEDGASDEEADDPMWRGGAAPRGGLRLVEDEEAAPTEEELRDAVLSLGDDELLAHDIWFVALGASALDHAGMRSFLSQHRRDVRGAFVVNLDCVGAGELTVLTREGTDVPRRSDRRLGRLLANAARDLHVEMGQARYDWTSTDAHPAMRSSMRAATIMGIDENGLPALSRTLDDVAENVSGDQAHAVAEIVTEMIRRS